MSYTPGPWWITNPIDGKVRIFDGRGGYICDCAPNNAPLIEQAPELLAALKAIVSDYHQHDISPGHSGGIDHSGCCRRCRALRAIAKAEGREA